MIDELCGESRTHVGAYLLCHCHAHAWEVIGKAVSRIQELSV